eukprot:COSAG05_NODE_297_length_11939_cov_17.362753_2_plen_131_part_00
MLAPAPAAAYAHVDAGGKLLQQRAAVARDEYEQLQQYGNGAPPAMDDDDDTADEDEGLQLQLAPDAEEGVLTEGEGYALEEEEQQQQDGGDDAMQSPLGRTRSNSTCKPHSRPTSSLLLYSCVHSNTGSE